MRKYYTLLMFLMCSLGMSAQTLKGDMDDDGELTITDVTMLINAYLNYEKPTHQNRNGHECVDLGLPSGTLWATCNVGASSPEKNGYLFAWGETTPKSEYDWMAYKWCSNSENTMTKYCINFLYGTVDKKTVLDLEDDAAHVNWGGDWRMPTADELNELHSKCTCTWTETKGVYGCMFEDPNGNSIFLPAAGYRRDDSLNGDGSDGYYWSSSLHSDYSSFASYLGLGSGYVNQYGNYRYYGQSVRPVCK